MSQPQTAQAPPSVQRLEMLFGFALSRSISVAAQLGIADLIKRKPQSAEELAQSTGTHPRSLYRMLRALAGAGLFTEGADGRFGLTPLGELLCSDVAGSLRSFAAMIADHVNFETWAELPYAIETGQPAFPHKFGKPWFAWLQEHADEAQAFNDAMTSMSAGAADSVLGGYDFSGIKKLVDVGGGHGLLLAAILAKYPGMRGVLYDAPSVIAGAKSVLAKQGVANRCELVAGDFFKSAPAGGHAYIRNHIIHDWSDAECTTILKHCHAGMAAGGKVLIVEMVIPEHNVPSLSKLLDLQMLVFLTGLERTAAEYRTLLSTAGFELTRIVPTNSAYSVIEGVKA